MSVISTSQIVITFSGDIDSNLMFASEDNAASPGEIQILTLAEDDNTITVPAGGSTVTGVTIIPPTTNTETITLKGDTDDVGIPLSKINPTSLSLAVGASSFLLTAGASIPGVRLVWT